MSDRVLVDRDLLDLTRLVLAEGDALLVSPKSGTLSPSFCDGIAASIQRSFERSGAQGVVIVSPVPLDLRVLTAAELVAAVAGHA